MRIVAMAVTAVMGVVICICSVKAADCPSSERCVIRDFSAQLWDSANILNGPQANFTIAVDCRPAVFDKSIKYEPGYTDRDVHSFGN
jgi:hypothetical protein